MSDSDDVTVPRPDVDLPAPATEPVGPADGFTWNPDGEELAKALLARAKAAGRPGRRAPSRKSGDGGSGGRTWRRRRAPGAGWSGPGSDDRDPQAVGSAVDRLIGEHGWAEDIAVHGAVARWDHVVGPEVAAHVQPEHYEDGVLTVRADSTAWATQVRLFAAELVRRFNAEIGDGSVTRVDVRGPQAPSWRRGPRSVPGRGPRDTYG
ncbi:DUF721 domain-containing protein [Jiangella sp. DSM 45060]|uniref:DUF721 domain-containing protein n=1 Tax=Jiangella sp. DSM 45060 TaxID=1798224 RepID=UPI00087BCA71|nr:DciA family protein [Jiangella sp. DSM 45060]SDT68917.1 Predicted nucleic acid-binding protein, contains Zn-ribbon domain (includes truncated derivatives) [Jiangella sp. DSM 45060]